MSVSKTIEECFWSKVKKTDACWEWQGSIGLRNRLHFKYAGKAFQANRVSWEIHKGAIPTGYRILNSCGNRLCVHPDHLFMKVLSGKVPPEDAFWDNVNKTGDCWEWRGDSHVFAVNGIATYVHRYSWELANGPIPVDNYVIQRCKNESCVRPDHLYLSDTRAIVPTEQRFWDKVNKTSTCWLWRGGTCGKGYGHFGYGDKCGMSHRYSWELHFGPIPDGLFVLHRCDTPACVRPDHLFLGTNQDNVDDMWEKGRGQLGEDHHQSYITEEMVRELRRLRKSGFTYAELEKLPWSPSQHAIWCICNRKTWKHVKDEEPSNA